MYSVGILDLPLLLAFIFLSDLVKHLLVLRVSVSTVAINQVSWVHLEQGVHVGSELWLVFHIFLVFPVQGFLDVEELLDLLPVTLLDVLLG